MKSTELRKPIVQGGVRSINFFNGRLLSGEDLTAEQAAQREWLGRLGRLAGPGVAAGLAVAETAVAGKAAVVIERGIAVNSLGQTLRLSEPFEVSLLQPSALEPPAALPVTKDFAACNPLQTGIYKAGDGLYLLTIAPALSTEGRVPTNGLGNVAASCATKYLVDAVTFHLIPLTSFFSSAELAASVRLRSMLAARCFGVADAKAFVTDPFGTPPTAAKLLDALGQNLPARDVPLAVLHWTAEGGIDFIDHWCVRRRLSGPPGEGAWSPPLTEQRHAEAEALLFQFQDQIEGLRTQTPEACVAKDHFAYLPPAGVLPLAGAAGFRGFTGAAFFQGLTVRDPIYIEGARLESLLRASLQFPPLDLASGEMLWSYHVRENAMKADGLDGTRVQPYIVFASGQLPYAADARFDISHWDYASYS